MCELLFSETTHVCIRNMKTFRVCGHGHCSLKIAFPLFTFLLDLMSFWEIRKFAVIESNLTLFELFRTTMALIYLMQRCRFILFVYCLSLKPLTRIFRWYGEVTIWYFIKAGTSSLCLALTADIYHLLRHGTSTLASSPRINLHVVAFYERQGGPIFTGRRFYK